MTETDTKSVTWRCAARTRVRRRFWTQLPPALAGDVAFRIFCTPELSQHRTHDHDELTARARFHLRHARWERVPTPAGEVQTYVFEPDGEPRGTVMLVHGWTSEAAFMTAFIEPLRRSGLRVVAFDFPAHGLSPGRRTNLADCARAMLARVRPLRPDRCRRRAFVRRLRLAARRRGRPAACDTRIRSSASC